MGEEHDRPVRLPAWRLRDLPADEIGAPGPSPSRIPAEVAHGDAGVRVLLTVEVDDVDAVCADLTARGVELLNGPIHRPWGPRTASFRDPAGHTGEIGT